MHFASLPQPTDAPRIAGTLYLPTFTGPDSTLAGPGRTPSPISLPGLVVGHGAGSRRSRHDSFCRIACTAGLAVLAIDFRGHGDSTGSVDGPLHHDVIAAAGFLRGHPLVDGTRIAYRGSSMGGYYGLLAADAAGLCALAVLCPASERVLLTGLDGAWAPDEGGRINESALRPFLESHTLVEAAEQVTCPTLLLHARDDSIVPLSDSLGLAAHLRGETEIIVMPGGDHRSLQASPVMHQRVTRWLIARTART